MLPKGSGCSAGLNVKERVADVRRSTDFKTLSLPARTVPLGVVGTSIGELLDRTDTKAILQEVLPVDFLNHPLIEQARSFGLERFS